MFVPNFKLLKQFLIIFDENFHIHCIGLRDRKKEKIEKEGKKINLCTLVLFTVIHLVVPIVYIKFEDCSTYRCLADQMEKMLERKKNGQIKGLISHMWLIL